MSDRHANGSGTAEPIFADITRLILANPDTKIAIVSLEETFELDTTGLDALLEFDANLRKRFALVAGRPGAGKPDPGATVCSCFGVGVNQIVAAVRGGCHSVEAVGKSLHAGTNCGSCRAEIRGVIDGCLATAAE